MKNICILKGWFDMEEFKNGAISEEALDEIAGGLSVSSSTVKNVLLAAGIGILSAGAGAGYAYLTSEDDIDDPAAPAVPAAPVAHPVASSGSGTAHKKSASKALISKGVDMDPIAFSKLGVKEKIKLFKKANPELK